MYTMSQGWALSVYCQKWFSITKSIGNNSRSERCYEEWKRKSTEKRRGTFISLIEIIKLEQIALRTGRTSMEIWHKGLGHVSDQVMSGKKPLKKR
jgi:sortase (surface protein transpeptidase)